MIDPYYISAKRYFSDVQIVHKFSVTPNLDVEVTIFNVQDRAILTMAD